MSGPGGHSPLGASGAKRWMACPGSVALSEGVYDEESDHAARGTAAHGVAEMCLRHDTDAWTHVGGTTEDGIPIDKAMADAVQQYLDDVRAAHPDRNQGNFFVERRFHCPTIHPSFYGTSDCIYVDLPARTLHVWDYKNGVLLVETKDNPQGMYYACGALEDLDMWHDIERVRIHIHQPNGFHYDGPHRTWEISTDDLALWLVDTLVPAMDRALVSRDTKSGEHCRFCPARALACPQLVKDMEEFEDMMKQKADELTAEQLSRLLELDELARIVVKAAKKTAFTRISSGHVVPGWGLVKQKSNRVYKDGAEVAAKDKFGVAAYSKPELLSPSQIEALPEGKAFAAQWAFKPDAGLTLVRETDARPKVSKDTKSLFKPVERKRA